MGLFHHGGGGLPRVPAQQKPHVITVNSTESFWELGLCMPAGDCLSVDLEVPLTEDEAGFLGRGAWTE